MAIWQQGVSDMDGAVLSTGSAFIIGALSKSIATVATYPMVRAKVRHETFSLSLFMPTIK